MEISKFKLILYWFLYILGFYLIWAVSYFITARYLLREIARYRTTRESFLTELTIGDLFWYFIFVAGLGLVTLIFRLMIEKAPNSRIAAFTYFLLVVASISFLLVDQSRVFHGYQIIAHIIVNVVFLIPMLIGMFSKPAS